MSRRNIVLFLIVSNLVIALLVLVFSRQLLRTRPIAWMTEMISGEHQLTPVLDATGDIAYWTCSMHPWVKMTEPGGCPICGMDLIPVREPSPESAGQDDPVAATDRSIFNVDPSRRQLINLQTSTVERRPLSRTIRTVGTLELDETRIFHIHSKTAGWIERVYVDAEHQHVMKGEPLFAIYSPNLVAAQEEYLLALRTAEELASSPFENVSRGARSLLQASRKKLELYDVTDEQVRELEKTGETQRHTVIYSPVSGHVIKRNAFLNQHISPETNVYVLADHHRLWAQVEIYEQDISLMRMGQWVTMTADAYPGRVFSGRISFIYPHLNPETRTLRVRLEFANPDLVLKPEMFVRAEVHIPLGTEIAIQPDSVIRTGKRNIVFVDLGEGQLQMREVELGHQTEDYVQVTEGLLPGEEIVTSANFLIDAESKIRGVEATWSTPRPQVSPRQSQRP